MEIAQIIALSILLIALYISYKSQLPNVEPKQNWSRVYDKDPLGREAIEAKKKLKQLEAIPFNERDTFTKELIEDYKNIIQEERKRRLF